MAIDRQPNSTVLFADIGGSTKLYVDAGDDRARAIVAQTLELWSAFTISSGGVVVQTRGDGILCLFPSVDAALGAAVRMRDLPYDESLSMHAGLHVGVVLREFEQLYGEVVNTAARMADIARRFEIVMTEAAQAQLTAAQDWPLRLIRNVHVKGRADPMNIFLLTSDKQALTEYDPPLPSRVTVDRLRLRYASCEYAIEGRKKTCLIGRDAACEIRVDHRLVSRRHASIECVSGRFFLHDHSTNGTYVSERNSAPVLVQRDIYQLRGSGVISLGAEPAADRAHVIDFSTAHT